MRVLNRLIYNIAEHRYAVRDTQVTKKNADNNNRIGKHHEIGLELGGQLLLADSVDKQIYIS